MTGVQTCALPISVLQGNGDLVRLAPGKPGRIAQVRSGRLVLDGDIISPADGEAMAARRRLAAHALVVVALAVSANGRVVSAVEVAAVGLPLDDDMDAFVAAAQADIERGVHGLKGAKGRDRDAVREAVRLAVRRAAQRWSGKKPVVQVMLRES